MFQFLEICWYDPDRNMTQIGRSIVYLAQHLLTLPAPCISESFVKMEINLIFFFALVCAVWKGFMKPFNAFIKPFEAPQRSVKIKNQVNFLSSSGIETRRVKIHSDPFPKRLWRVINYSCFHKKYFKMFLRKTLWGKTFNDLEINLLYYSISDFRVAITLW